MCLFINLLTDLFFIFLVVVCQHLHISGIILTIKKKSTDYNSTCIKKDLFFSYREILNCSQISVKTMNLATLSLADLSIAPLLLKKKIHRADMGAA